MYFPVTTPVKLTHAGQFHSRDAIGFVVEFPENDPDLLPLAEKYTAVIWMDRRGPPYFHPNYGLRFSLVADNALERAALPLRTHLTLLASEQPIATVD